MSDRVSVGVVGGGIGGLSATLSLLHAGFDVHVYEQAAALGEVGAGIQISPNASRLLHRLGLAAELARTGVKPLAWHQRRWDDGRTLLRSPLAEPLEATFGFPHYQLHRADLLAALATAIPAERVHLGHRLTELTDRGDQVEARFANGAQVAVDVLVGADGIHSVVRRLLFGEAEPRFTGLRGLPRPRPGRAATRPATGGDRAGVDGPWPALRALLRERAPPRQLRRDRRAGRLDPGVVDARGDLAAALAAFEGWHPQVRTILGSVDETFIWGLFDRRPLERWSVGRVTLLGDACHAMLPFMAQGAAQAIEDGATLTACLAGAEKDIPAALRRYERLRLPRASRLQAMSTDNKTALPSARRPGTARAGPADGDRLDRLVVRRRGLDLRTRRRGDPLKR